jgi:hypothetical protein
MICIKCGKIIEPRIELLILEKHYEPICGYCKAAQFAKLQNEIIFGGIVNPCNTFRDYIKDDTPDQTPVDWDVEVKQLHDMVEKLRQNWRAKP